MKNIPCYRQLTLVLIKLFEIHATNINANWGKNYFPIKVINGKVVLNFKMREIKATYTKKQNLIRQQERIILTQSVKLRNCP